MASRQRPARICPGSRRTARRVLPHRRRHPGRAAFGRYRRHPGAGDAACAGDRRSQRPIWWLHTTRNRATHAFAAEATGLVQSLPDARQHVFYTAGESDDDTVVRGRLDEKSIAALGLSTDATVYLCGPGPFLDDMRAALTAAGIDSGRIHTELFGAL